MWKPPYPADNPTLKIAIGVKFFYSIHKKAPLALTNCYKNTNLPDPQV